MNSHKGNPDVPELGNTDCPTAARIWDKTSSLLVLMDRFVFAQKLVFMSNQ